MKTVETTMPDWRQKCLEFTQAREDFVVKGISDKDQAFLRKLCRESNYRQFIINEGLLFMPGF